MEEEYTREIYKKKPNGGYVKNNIIPLTKDPYVNYGSAVSNLEETTKNSTPKGNMEWEYMRGVYRNWIEDNTTYKFGEDMPVFELFENYMNLIEENDIFRQNKRISYLLFIRFVGVWRNIGTKRVIINNKKMKIAVITNHTYASSIKTLNECEGNYEILRKKIMNYEEVSNI